MKERLVTHDDMTNELRRIQKINAEYLAKIDSLTRLVQKYLISLLSYTTNNCTNYFCLKEFIFFVFSSSSSLFSENIRIPGLENQVTSYKRKLTDTKVEMSLAVAKNREMQKEINELIANQSGLENGLAAAIESNCAFSIQQSLAAEADAELGEGTKFAALGAAMSEVNPEIRERLVTLERENKIMKEKLGKTDLAAIDQLEERLIDAEQLRDAFEGKYVEKVKEVKSLQKNLNHMSDELSQERKQRAEDLVCVKMHANNGDNYLPLL